MRRPKQQFWTSESRDFDLDNQQRTGASERRLQRSEFKEFGRAKRQKVGDNIDEQTAKETGEIGVIQAEILLETAPILEFWGRTRRKDEFRPYLDDFSPDFRAEGRFGTSRNWGTKRQSICTRKFGSQDYY